MLNKKYLGAASIQIQEMFDSITPEDKKQMKELFDGISPEKYKQYYNEVYKDLFPFIESKATDRLHETKWNEPGYNLKLKYFSFYTLQRGYLLMTRLSMMPNRNGLRRVVGFFSMMADNICNKELTDSVFNDELTYKDFN